MSGKEFLEAENRRLRSENRKLRRLAEWAILGLESAVQEGAGKLTRLREEWNKFAEDPPMETDRHQD